RRKAKAAGGAKGTANGQRPTKRPAKTTTSNENRLPSAVTGCHQVTVRDFFKLFQAARFQAKRLVSFLRSYRNWLPSADSGYASRTVRQAIRWSNDHGSD